MDVPITVSATITEEFETGTYHVANVSALDEQPTCQYPIFIKNFVAPAISTSIVMNLLLQVAEIGHIFKVNAHVSGQDGLDQKRPQAGVLESTVPMPPEDLRVRSAVKGFEHRAVIV